MAYELEEMKQQYDEIKNFKSPKSVKKTTEQEHKYIITEKACLQSTCIFLEYIKV